MQIIAHRGASAAAPENTLPAFELACKLGADMLEVDIQRSADGVLVVFHDATTARWNGTAQPVAALTLAELRLLDIGGAQICTLAEVCALAQRHAVGLVLDIKQADATAQAVTQVAAAGLAEQTIISSFAVAALHTARQTAPQMRRALLMGTRTYHPIVRAHELWPFLLLRATGATAWHPAARLPLVRRLLPLVRRAGYAVNVWTVNEAALARRLRAWGATGLITDYPDVRAELREHR